MQSRHSEVLEQLRLKLGSDLVAVKLRESREGSKVSLVLYSIWISVNHEKLREAVEILAEFGPLHVSTPMASKEFEENLELIYHFALFGGNDDLQELPVIIAVSVPKTDLRVGTLTDLVPGILFMERETIEMLGVEVMGIPDKSRLWTHDKLASGFKPMRGVMHSAEKEVGGVEE